MPIIAFGIYWFLCCITTSVDISFSIGKWMLPIEEEMSTEVVIQHRNQYMPKAMMGTSDSDFAGHQSLRRSTSMQWVRTAPDGQSTVSCRSPESEYHEAVKTTSITMDNQPVSNNMDDEVGMEILSEASSGIGLAIRRGFGRTRHGAETRFLRIKRQTRNRTIHN